MHPYLGIDNLWRSVMQLPQRVLISRIGGDHERWQQVPGVVTTAPSVGESLQMFLESGKIMRTSPVTRVANDEDEMVVDTHNSRYRLKLAS
jgi:hypothetical protein